jgi:hypothetical protein
MQRNCTLVSFIHDAICGMNGEADRSDGVALFINYSADETTERTRVLQLEVV